MGMHNQWPQSLQTKTFLTIQHLSPGFSKMFICKGNSEDFIFIIKILLNKTKFHRLKCKIPRRRWHRHSFFTLVTCQNIDHKIKLEFELWHPANPWPHLSSHHQSILGIAWFCIKHYSQGLRIIRWIFGYFFDTPYLRNAFLSIFWRVFMRLYNSHLLRGSSLKNIHSSSWNRASLRSQLENREIFCPFRCRHLTMIKSVVFWLFLGQSYFRQN